MRLCILCSEYPPGPHGGIGTRYRILGRHLAAAGHEVRVIGAYPRDYPAPDYEEDQGVRVWRLRAGGGRVGWIPAWRRLYRQVHAWTEAGEVDLVEAPDSRGWFALWPRQPVPLVLRSSGSNVYFARELGRRPNRLTAWMEADSYRRADAWIAQTRHSAALTREIFRLGPPDLIVPNVIDPPPEVPSFASRDPYAVVFSGTLTQKKGVEPLMAAWPKVVARVPEARLTLFGKDTVRPEGGGMREHLVGRLPEAVRGTVTFAGHVSRATLFDALARARAGVFPSYTETFGNVAVESMAWGCPTVYTTRSVGPEVVADGEEGLLVDPDHPEQIADALVRLLTDDALAARLGAAGRAHVLRDYTPEAVLPPTLDLYHRLIHPASVGARTPRGGAT
ncbi:MAG: glycosyltransferase family 4 protein [Bacteroidota bacterium]